MFYFFLLFIFIVKVVFGLYYISSSHAKPPDSLTIIFDESKRIGYLASEDDIIYDFHLSFGVFIFQNISKVNMLIISGRIKVHILRKICQFLTLFLLTDVKKRDKINHGGEQKYPNYRLAKATLFKYPKSEFVRIRCFP